LQKQTLQIKVLKLFTLCKKTVGIFIQVCETLTKILGMLKELILVEFSIFPAEDTGKHSFF
jgi:hypothetical protein